MRTIIQRFETKIQQSADSYVYLYSGGQVKLDLTFEQQANHLNKTNESDENVVIGNISLNTTIKNSVNTNFNNTGKTNTLAKEMKLNEVEEKEEEELYESEFKENIKCYGFKKIKEK